MYCYRTKTSSFSKSKGRKIYSEAYSIYKGIALNTKRKPYVRSTYFRGEKIFFDIFWSHLNDKRWKDKLRRLRFLPCAIDLIRNSKVIPTIKIEPQYTFYRFFGVTKKNEYFCVQIKKITKSNRSYFMSVFPVEKKKVPAARGST